MHLSLVGSHTYPFLQPVPPLLLSVQHGDPCCMPQRVHSPCVPMFVCSPFRNKNVHRCSSLARGTRPLIQPALQLQSHSMSSGMSQTARSRSPHRPDFWRPSPLLSSLSPLSSLSAELGCAHGGGQAAAAGDLRRLPNDCAGERARPCQSKSFSPVRLSPSAQSCVFQK